MKTFFKYFVATIITILGLPAIIVASVFVGIICAIELIATTVDNFLG